MKNKFQTVKFVYQQRKLNNVPFKLPKNLHAETKRCLDIAYGMKHFGDAD